MNTMILIRDLHHAQHKYYIHFSATGYIETLRGLFLLHVPSTLHFFLGRILNYNHTITLYLQSAQKLYSKFRGINFGYFNIYIQLFHKYKELSYALSIYV